MGQDPFFVSLTFILQRDKVSDCSECRLAIGLDFCRRDPDVQKSDVRCLTKWLVKLMWYKDCTCFSFASWWFVDGHESIHLTSETLEHHTWRNTQKTSYTGPAIPKSHRNSGSEHPLMALGAFTNPTTAAAVAGRCGEVALRQVPEPNVEYLTLILVLFFHHKNTDS